MSGPGPIAPIDSDHILILNAHGVPKLISRPQRESGSRDCLTPEAPAAATRIRPVAQSDEKRG
jgi:hypothetical protein